MAWVASRGRRIQQLGDDMFLYGLDLTKKTPGKPGHTSLYRFVVRMCEDLSFRY